jgi:MFS family permease
LAFVDGHHGTYVLKPHEVAAPPPSVHGLKSLLSSARLRLLVFVRVINAIGDGAFQGALVGSVLFSPEKAANPAELALGFGLMVLPYSIIGPFVGSLLDRWSRRQVLVWSNVLRCAIVFTVALEIAVNSPLWLEFGTALLVMGVGRFIGACTSAAMPHCVAPDSLIAANSLATTAGAAASAIGGGAALGASALMDSSNVSLAIVTGCVIPVYLAASLTARRFGRWALGPDEADEPAEPVIAILTGLSAGFKHIKDRPRVAIAVSMVMAVRFCFGLATLLVLVLFQSVFQASGIFRAGPAGIVEALGFATAGVVLAALVTAPAVNRLGRIRWVTAVLLGAAFVSAMAAIRINPPVAMTVALLLGFAYQSTKICADAVVQTDCDDAHIGRVYSVYDTTNNVFYVAGMVLGALMFTDRGSGRALIIVIAAIYLVTALGYGSGMRRYDKQPVPAHG